MFAIIVFLVCFYFIYKKLNMMEGKTSRTKHVVVSRDFPLGSLGCIYEVYKPQVVTNKKESVKLLGWDGNKI